MPIRINLKELFSSDPQEISVEKVNFNFNKLLELGVGSPGPIGVTGPQGPAGPIGLTGQQGPRGATWWVDSGDPNLITFPSGSLIDGDLYLDNTGFVTWRYDLATDTWSQVVSIASVVNSYLSLNGSPFSTDFRDPQTTPINKRFVAFSARATSPAEIGRRGGAVKNSVLFLNNYDENDPNYQIPANVNNLHTSLLNLSTDHHSIQYEASRFHLEFSSIYSTTGPLAKISELNENLKIQYYRSSIDQPAQLPNTSSLAEGFINVGVISLSVPDSDSLQDPLSSGPTRTQGVKSNSILKIKLPKVDLDGFYPETIGNGAGQEGINVYFSPWEALREFDNSTLGHIVADGLTFHMEIADRNATIGIANFYQSSNTRLDNRHFFMVDETGLDGILLDDYTYIQNNLNVLTKLSIGNVDPTSHLTVVGNASIGSGYSANQAPADGAIIEGKLGVGTNSPSAKVQITNTTGDDSFLVEDEASSDTTPFVIKNDGKVGVGITTPTAKVHINNSTTDNSFLVEDSANVDTTPFVITNSGDVGIGTDSPSHLAHIKGKLRVEDGTQVDKAILQCDSTGLSGWTPFSAIGVPTGAVVSYFGSAAPAGWLVCDGSLIPNLPEYAALRAVCFNILSQYRVPDLRERFIVGAGNDSGLAGGPYSVAATGGYHEVALIESQLPSHKHDLEDPPTTPASPAIAFTNLTGAHTHGVKRDVDTAGPNRGTTLDHKDDQKFDGPLYQYQGQLSTEGNHQHVVQGRTAYTGSGSAHTNLPPYYALTYIIKY